jgi:transposase
MNIEKTVDTKTDLYKLPVKNNEIYYVLGDDRLYKRKKGKWSQFNPKCIYMRQGRNYKNEYEVTRNVNLRICASPNQIRSDFFDKMCSILNKCMNSIVRSFKSGEFGSLDDFVQELNKKSFPENLCKPVEEGGLGKTTFYSDLGFHDVVLERKNGSKKVVVPEKQSIPKRGFLKWSSERILAPIKRFRKRKGVVKTKKIENNIRLHASQVKKIKNGKVYIRPFYVNEEFEYDIEPYRKNGRRSPSYSTIMKRLEEKDSLGGNLRVDANDVVLTQQLTFKNKWMYEPLDFIGFDMNKTSDSFMVFSKEIKLFNKNMSVVKKKDMDRKIIRLEEQLAELVKKGRGVRRKILNVHKKLTRLYRAYITELLGFIKDNKLCICVDHLKTGDKNGSFGQDKVSHLIVEICEAQGIPFVLVPTPYTTRICSCCSFVNPKQELSVRKFNCGECGKELVRDFNAAKNVELIGRKIWTDGMIPTLLEYKNGKGINILKYK